MMLSIKAVCWAKMAALTVILHDFQTWISAANRMRNQVHNSCLYIFYSVPLESAHDVSSVPFHFSRGKLWQLWVFSSWDFNSGSAVSCSRGRMKDTYSLQWQVPDTSVGTVNVIHLHVDGLHLGIVVQGVGPVLATKAGFFVASKGHAHRVDIVIIDVQRACFHLGCHAVRPAQVAEKMSPQTSKWNKCFETIWKQNNDYTWKFFKWTNCRWSIKQS